MISNILSIWCKNLSVAVSLSWQVWGKGTPAAAVSFAEAQNDSAELETILTKLEAFPANIRLCLSFNKRTRYLCNCFLHDNRSRISNDWATEILSATAKSRYNTFSNTGDT